MVANFHWWSWCSASHTDWLLFFQGHFLLWWTGHKNLEIPVETHGMVLQALLQNGLVSGHWFSELFIQVLLRASVWLGWGLGVGATCQHMSECIPKFGLHLKPGGSESSPDSNKLVNSAKVYLKNLVLVSAQTDMNPLTSPQWQNKNT